MSLNNILQSELKKIQHNNLFRSPNCVESAQGTVVKLNEKEVVLFCANNYLGLANDSRLIEAAIKTAKDYGIGSSASPLVSGNMKIHQHLQEKIAEFKKCEDAVLFNTGYAANIGTISAVVGRDDIVISDKLNHASIIDGCKFSGAKLYRYAHCQVDALEVVLKKVSYSRKPKQKILVITDTVFSMDGDIAPIDKILKLVKKYDGILMIDDAHSTGVLGNKGRGGADYFNLKSEIIDIQMGTFSKAFGSLGGYVAGSKNLCNYLRNKARSFIYSTAISPVLAGVSLEALNIISSDEGDNLRKRLWSNTEKLMMGLKKLNYNTMNSQTYIIPVFIGDINRTMKLCEQLFDQGIFTVGIRPPTVPKGTSRIRLSVMATHTGQQIDKLLSVFTNKA